MAIIQCSELTSIIFAECNQILTGNAPESSRKSSLDNRDSYSNKYIINNLRENKEWAGTPLLVSI